MERKKVCSVMDCQKLSREACAHAAQNDRLPVQTVVQVLYYEQQRIREVTDSSLSESHALPAEVVLNTIDVHPVSDELSNLRRENQQLKLELAKMKMRLKEMEKPTDKSAVNSPLIGISHPSSGKPPLPRKSLMSSVSKTLGKILRADAIVPQNNKGRNRPNKNWRHSIS